MSVWPLCPIPAIASRRGALWSATYAASASCTTVVTVFPSRAARYLISVRSDSSARIVVRFTVASQRGRYAYDSIPGGPNPRVLKRKATFAHRNPNWVGRSSRNGRHTIAACRRLCYHRGAELPPPERRTGRGCTLLLRSTPFFPLILLLVLSACSAGAPPAGGNGSASQTAPAGQGRTLR